MTSSHGISRRRLVGAATALAVAPLIASRNQILGLQTEDHIYGWRSQAVELDQCHDLLFANSVFFRVATVLGPYPHGVGLRDSQRITFRGNRGYRDKTPEFTQWGAAVADLRTGRTVPDPEFTLLNIR